MSTQIAGNPILACPSCESTHLVEESPGAYLCLYCNASLRARSNGKLRVNGRQCANCGYGNTSRATACRKCGQALVKHCLNCDAALGLWEDTCPRCGTGQAAFEQQLTIQREQATTVATEPPAPARQPVEDTSAPPTPVPTQTATPASTPRRSAPYRRAARARPRRRFNVWRYAWLWWLIWPLSGVIRHGLANVSSMMNNASPMMSTLINNNGLLPLLLIAAGVVMLVTTMTRA